MKVSGVLLCAERGSVNIVAGDEKFIMEKKGTLWMKKNKFVKATHPRILNNFRTFLQCI